MGAPPGHSAGAGPGRGFGGGSNPDLGDLELPEGVDARDVEEARMLEAAMLGIQYEGPMPDFSSRCGAGMQNVSVGARQCPPTLTFSMPCLPPSLSPAFTNLPALTLCLPCLSPAPPIADLHGHLHPLTQRCVWRVA